MMRRLIVCIISFPLLLLALPKELDVQRGHVSLKQNGSDLHIDNSQDAILNWQEFSIGRGENVHFSSTSLNRVTGKNCSNLLGKLTSDGMIFLINPNGITIGGNASIQTGGFLASTADISNEDFISRKELHFHSIGSGKILNQGHISCPKGKIFLISKTVQNEGRLSGKHVHLLSGQDIMIRPKENDKVLIRAAVSEGQIENTGVIEALTIDLQVVSPYEKAISQNGHIEASATHKENGRIYLIAKNGSCRVNGSMIGKNVHVLGKEAVLKEHTYIDASGPQGGQILIGGDRQGNNPTILNAKKTTAEKGSTLKANSTKGGNGGKIIYWSDGITKVASTSNVCGGPEGGDGGFIEVSGKQQFTYTGQSHRAAPKGKPGTLLLDPDADITISSAVDASITTAGSPVTIEPTAAAANISTLPLQTLLTELASGDVIITTEFAGGGGSGDITFMAGSPFSWSTNSLTINAGQDVLFNANVTNSGAGNFVVNANRSINVASGVTVESTSSGDITLNANTTGLTTGNFSGLELQPTAQILIGSGALSVTAHGGDTGTDNQGILIDLNAQIGSMNSGVITLTGTGGTGFDSNQGIRLQGGEINGDTGDITIQGMGQGDGGGNDGVQLDFGTISSTAGKLSITGIASTPSGNASQGVRNIGTRIETTSGDIEIFGQGSSPLGGQGFAITDAGVITTEDGQISITGLSLLADANVSVADLGTEVSATGTGSITLIGLASPSSQVESGIRVVNGGLVSTQSGALNLIGRGGQGGSGINMLSGGRVESNTGPIFIEGTGGINPNNQAGVRVSGLGSAITSVSAPISITGNGRGTDSNNRGIEVSSSAVISSGSGPITLNGTGSNTAAGMNNSAVSVSGTFTRVETSTGSIQINGNGGIGGSSNLGIQIDGSGQCISTSGPVTLNGTGGRGSGENYGIAIENIGSQVSSSTGEITLTGSAGASTQEGILINTNGAVTSTGNSPTTLRTFSDILIQTNGSVTAQGSGSLLLDASESIRLETSSLVSTNTGNLTLVVDSRFPTPPNIGTGAFIIDAGATLTSQGEMRIYTARQSQNSVSGLINGSTFIPGPFNTNTAIETWSTYFPEGSYGGLAFNFYYKEPILSPITSTVYRNIAANLVQLADLLPNLRSKQRPFAFPSYHFQVCEKQQCAPNALSNKNSQICNEELCAPTFSPYGSFIFEDDLWWIGETF